MFAVDACLFVFIVLLLFRNAVFAEVKQCARNTIHGLPIQNELFFVTDTNCKRIFWDKCPFVWRRD